MADPLTYRPAPGEVPTSPGVYRFLDREGQVIYVGKAKNLRSRLANYFQDLSALHPRTQKMVTTACAVEWTVVGTEVEALALEYAWIKQFNPRFNVMYKDDKSYPYLAVTMTELFPRAQIVRGARKRGNRYFGPFVHVWSIRETLDQLLRVFPMRSCSAGVFQRAKAARRPCLLGYIDKCCAPCIGRVTAEEHRKIAQDLCAFLSGQTRPYLHKLETQMRRAAKDLDFEKAARIRDNIAALQKVIERNAVVLPDATDADVFALVRDELTAAVQVFHVRGGRVRGQRGLVIDLVEEITTADLIERLLQQMYADLIEPSDQTANTTAAPAHSGPTTELGVGGRAPAKPGLRAENAKNKKALAEAATSVDDVIHTATTAVPREILVPVLPSNAQAITRWLSQLRGAKVQVRVPQRGDKAALMETVRKNAAETLRLHKTRRIADITSRSQALEELAQTLHLPQAPLRMECYDISHTQGTYQVGSMVVFEDGVPKKSAYRHFVIHGEQGQGAPDDTAAMAEVLTRRFKRMLAEESSFPVQSRQLERSEWMSAAALQNSPDKPHRFSYRPNLLVVDGGLPQVNAARAVLADLGVEIPLIGLAKRLEEVWVPGEEFPIILPRTSPALYLLQHLRDESHRVAISHHRAKRARGMTRSVLDDIPGLGPARQAALLKQFGSVKRLREASVEDLTQVKGVGVALAQLIKEKLAT